MRAENAQLFALGSYQPLQVDGEKKDNVFAFARTHEGQTCVVIVPRWPARLMAGRTELPLGDVWGDTKVLLGAGVADDLRDALTAQVARVEGEEGALRVSDVLSKFPIAVLRSTASSARATTA